ncbi:peroxiredoxin [Marinomonas agarivorans]|nr:peroxiredoxin [Marinomonas agarivorans]
MSIQVGDMLPVGQFQVMNENGPQTVDTNDFFSNKKVILFAVPGAFTPTCSASHLPGYVTHYEAFKEKGIDEVVCLSVNDVFVMDAWGQSQGADQIVMAADGLAELTLSMGLELDISTAKLGVRSRRYAMLVENGIVRELWEEEPGEFSVSSAEYVLSHLA